MILQPVSLGDGAKTPNRRRIYNLFPWKYQIRVHLTQEDFSTIPTTACFPGNRIKNPACFPGNSPGAVVFGCTFHPQQITGRATIMPMGRAMVDGMDGDSFGNMARLYRMNTILRIWCWANYIQIFLGPFEKNWRKKCINWTERYYLASSRSNTHTATASNRRRMANWPVAGAGEKKYSPLKEKNTHTATAEAWGGWPAAGAGDNRSSKVRTWHSRLNHFFCLNIFWKSDKWKWMAKWCQEKPQGGHVTVTA